MDEIEITIDLRERDAHIKKYLEINGLSHIQEDLSAAYCAISLTGVDKKVLGPILSSRQKTLKEKILAPLDIRGYDPKEAPYSPDNNPTAQRDEICKVDTGRIVGARYFAMISISPSTGMGVEMQKAEELLRMSVILTDNNITDSRMKAARIINLGYDNLEKQASQISQVFRMLQEYTPGAGLKNGQPILIGFPNKGGNPVNLEELTHSTFPDLRYTHRGEISPVKQKPTDPSQFYETET